MSEQFARWLAQSGDTLHSVARALAPDERATRRLLRHWAQSLAADPPADWQSDVLMARLYQIAVSRFGSLPLQRLPAPPTAPIAGPLRALPLDQRMAVLAHVLFGAGRARLATVLGVDAASAAQILEQAVRALAPHTGHRLPDPSAEAECQFVRQALIDPAQYAQMLDPARRHLARCPECRDFDREWQAATRNLRDALRRYAQTQPLPAALGPQLLRAMVRPRSRLATLINLAPVLALVALLGSLALPGMLRQPVTIVESSAAAVSLSAAELVALALPHGGIPEPEGPPVWQARYQTLWYFNNRTVAPLVAEIWHDRDNPARHRLQLRHIDGGAPYEFQLGDGRRRFYYAIDGAYAPVIYGDWPVRAAQDAPDLVIGELSPIEQQAAFAARRASGPWSIVPAYLRQAAQAPDLRLLGRQRIGDRMAAIVSFRAVSPLDLPADVAEPVTVLMAIAEPDGHVVSVTELIGPPGSTQTSRVVWRLLGFNWLVTGEQIRDAFTFERAWNGRADADTRVAQSIAYLELPLITRRNVVDMTQALANRAAIWLPATLPSGIERASLIRFRGETIDGALYTGPERRLLITFDRLPGIDPAVPTEIIGRWRARIEPVRGQHYRVAIEENNPQRRSGARLALDAIGFSADELRDLIASLNLTQQLDSDSLKPFFALPASAAPVLPPTAPYPVPTTESPYPVPPGRSP